MSKKQSLDQYYTSDVAAKILHKIVARYWQGERMLEPSVGTGALLSDNCTDWLLYDIDPKCKGAIKADFLQVDPDNFKGCFAIGNPPFGFCARLAIKFINHCAKSCDKICFILPDTFKKELFFDKHLDRHLHLTHVEDLPKNSFILDGKPYDVPCSVFYIEKRESLRPVLKWRRFLTITCLDDAYYVRRVGGRAGQLVDSYTPSSTYKVTSYIGDVPEYLEKYSEEIKQVASYTAGVRSITLDELNYIITKGETKC